MNKKLFFISLLAFLASQVLFSQSEFLEGYILKSEHDTLYGKIENRSYYQNSIQVNFIENNRNNVVKFSPDEIFGYRFSNGKYYISENVRINGHQKNIFLEYIVNGRLNIYIYQDKLLWNHYFVSKDSLPIEELGYREYIKRVDGRNYRVENKPFVGMLKFILIFLCFPMEPR